MIKGSEAQSLRYSVTMHSIDHCTQDCNYRHTQLADVRRSKSTESLEGSEAVAITHTAGKRNHKHTGVKGDTGFVTTHKAGKHYRDTVTSTQS